MTLYLGNVSVNQARCVLASHSPLNSSVYQFAHSSHTSHRNISRRVSSNLELGRNEDAIVDATLALRELYCLQEGAEANFWDIIYERKDEETLV